MMVGVPVLFIVCVSAFVPFVWVMGVVVGVSGCCVFHWWVAVVSARRRVPGVLACVVLWACSGAGVAWLWVHGVCVVGLVLWFRMLMRVVPLSVFLFCCLGFACLFG